MSLEVKNGKAGQTVEVTCGESLSGDAVGSTWGWVQQWTLRDGAQTLTQHKYMECRFVQLTFSGAMALDGFTLTAWKTHYAWYEEDSHFASSNATLDAVWDLCRYTLDAASLDSYTDSNTRERTVYEADGIIAATNRLLVQRDLLWGRHSRASALPPLVLSPCLITDANGPLLVQIHSSSTTTPGLWSGSKFRPSFSGRTTWPVEPLTLQRRSRRTLIRRP
jgi:hypothetical protein